MILTLPRWPGALSFRPSYAGRTDRSTESGSRKRLPGTACRRAAWAVFVSISNDLTGVRVRRRDHVRRTDHNGRIRHTADGRTDMGICNSRTDSRRTGARSRKPTRALLESTASKSHRTTGRSRTDRGTCTCNGRTDPGTGDDAHTHGRGMRRREVPCRRRGQLTAARSCLRRHAARHSCRVRHAVHRRLRL
jgi:hypothetical protein